MSLDRLWAGWRSAYIDEVSAQPFRERPGCVMCALAAADDDEAQVVAREGGVFAVLNAFPYVSGHLMVVPVRHEAELDGLSPDEASAVMAMVRRAVQAVRAAYAPEGINVGINLGEAAGAGVPGHIHVHVLPRWRGDTNFMTSVAETRVMPEPLVATLERLRAAWPVPD